MFPKKPHLEKKLKGHLLNLNLILRWKLQQRNSLKRYHSSDKCATLFPLAKILLQINAIKLKQKKFKIS